MCAMTLSNVKVSPMPNGEYLVHGTATASNEYATGGEPLDLSSYLKSTGAVTDGFVVTLNGDDGYMPQHDRGTVSAGKVLFYEAGADGAALDEVAASTDLSACVCTFIAIGPAA